MFSSKSSDTIHAPTAILVNKVKELGFNEEPTLGNNYHRSLYNAGNLIDENKGTLKGISAYVTALTHWDNDIMVGQNIMLDYNDSSFEETVGNWAVYQNGVEVGGEVGDETVENGPFASVLYSSPSDAPVPPLFDPLFPPRNAGYGVLTTSSTTPYIMYLPDSELSKRTYGIPVEENKRYIFTGWVKQLDSVAATVTATITWYNSLGTSLGSTSVGPTFTTTTSWQEFTSACDSGRNGQVAPRTATYAALVLTVTAASATTGRLAFDMFMMSEADKSFEYEDARRINVYVSGELENYVINPSFEEGVGFWTASPNSSFAQDPTVYPQAQVFPLVEKPYGPTSWGRAHVGELTVFLDLEEFMLQHGLHQTGFL
jgi:hypothetical protein